MKFNEALVHMQHNIPVRHPGLQSNSYIGIIDEEIRLLSSLSAYTTPYLCNLSDFVRDDWYTITHEEWNTNIDAALRESKTFIEAVVLMCSGFICGIKDDPLQELYGIENNKLCTIHINNGGDIVAAYHEVCASERHYKAQWYVVGYPKLKA